MGILIHCNMEIHTIQKTYIYTHIYKYNYIIKAIMSHADHSFDPTEKSVVFFCPI